MNGIDNELKMKALGILLMDSDNKEYFEYDEIIIEVTVNKELCVKLNEWKNGNIAELIK